MSSSKRKLQNQQREKRARQRAAKNNAASATEEMFERLRACVPKYNDDLEAGVREYCNFMLCKLTHDEPETLSPSAEIDEIWHNHILYTKHYRDDICLIASEGERRGISGVQDQMIHHLAADLETGGEPPAATFARYARRMCTRLHYLSVIGKVASGPYWPLMFNPTPFNVVVKRGSSEFVVSTSDAMNVLTLREKVGDHFGVQSSRVHLRIGSKERGRWLSGYMDIVGPYFICPNDVLTMVDEVDDYTQRYVHMQVYVKMLSGKTVTIDTDEAETVMSFKKHIEWKEGIPPKQQRLIFSGKQLSNDRILADYNIHCGTTLFLTLNLSGC